MRNLKLLFMMGVMFLSSGILNAQTDKKDEKKNSLTICAEVRPRTEYVHGVSKPMLEWNIPNEYKATGMLFTSQRARLGTHFKSKKFEFAIQLQDVRNWGSQAKLVNNTSKKYNINELDYTSVHQAWGQMNFTDEFSLKVGRMELSYDDQRILGAINWTQQAYSHDVALFKYEGAIKAHLGFAYHGAPFKGLDSYKAMQFLWINGKAADLGYSFLFLNNGKTENGIWFDATAPDGYIGVAERNAYSQIIGGHFTYKLLGGDLNVSLNSYYQMGKNANNWIDTKSLPTGVTLDMYNVGVVATGKKPLKDAKGKGQKISAYNFAFDAMYKVTDDFKAGLGYEMLSGNSYKSIADGGGATSENENAFAPLHGTNHKFNGWMDYFYVGNHGSNVGLQDINLKLIYKNGPFFAKLIPHYFMAAGKKQYVDMNGNTQDLKALGTEVDFWAGYNFIPKVASIQFGYSHMIATEGMYALKGVGLSATNGIGTNNWAWIMIDIKPKWNFKK